MVQATKEKKERKPKVKAKADETRDERMHVKLDDLLPNPYQPPTRIEVGEETAKRFGLSIQEHGLLQMPVVRVSNQVNKFEVGDGWLRLSGYRWLVKNGHPEYAEIPVVLRGFSDQEMADLIIEANSVRQDMNPIELAWYYQRVLGDFKGMTQAKFAQRHNISQSEVANTIRLLDLPDEVQKMIIARGITESHGRALLAVKDKATITKLAGEIVQYGWSVNTLNNVIKADADKIAPKMIETAQEPKAETKPPEAETKEPQIETPSPVTAEADENEEDDDTDGGAEEKTPASTTAKKPEAKKTEAVKFEKCVDCKSSLPERMLTDGRCKTCHEKATRPKLAKPEAVGAPPTEAAGAWKRKLILEEVGDSVKLSVMAEGKFPVTLAFAGTLEESVAEIAGFLADANTKWEAK